MRNFMSTLAVAMMLIFGLSSFPSVDSKKEMMKPSPSDCFEIADAAADAYGSHEDVSYLEEHQFISRGI